jgi:hypothetical protein
MSPHGMLANRDDVDLMMVNDISDVSNQHDDSREVGEDGGP